MKLLSPDAISRHSQEVRKAYGNPLAFTLVELMVVIGIISILSLLSFGLWKKAKASVLESKALNNVRSAAQLMHLYAQDHNGRFPRGWWTPSADREGGVQQTWQEQLAPYLLSSNLNNPGELRRLLRRSSNSSLMDPAAPLPMNGEDLPSLGINVNICDNYWDGWKGYVLRVPHPTETILLGSRSVSSGSSDYLWSLNNSLWSSINPGLYHRSKRAGVFVFVDGHAEVLDQDTLTPETKEAEARPELWRWPQN